MAKKSRGKATADPEKVPQSEPEAEECPKCPPVGAPAWMATFADMATLLMAFFVLILAFAEFNIPKFKMLSGSMRDAFGVQTEIPVMDMPKGTTVMSLNFSPSPNPSVTQEMTQQTTERDQPELELKTKEADGGPDSGAGEGSGVSHAEMLAALEQAILSGEVTLDVSGEEVLLEFQKQNKATTEEELRDLVQQAADALEAAQAAKGQDDTVPLSDGLQQQLDRLAALNEPESAADALADAAQAAEEATRSALAQEYAAKAADQLKVSLSEEIGSGLVLVEKREDKVIITVGAGGAFPSGSAALTSDARDIMTRIAFASMKSSSNISISGHTDNDRIKGGGRFQDNWDLAAARSASVVRQINSTGLVDPTRITAISYGETRPVADNSTQAGRIQNRRIEIEISY